MYPDIVKHFILCKETTGLEVSHFLEEVDDNDLTASNIGYKVNLENINSPDFAIRGHYQSIRQGQKHQFHIDRQGDHILYITGLPINRSDEFFNKCLISPKSSFRSYHQTEKSNIGFLIQILNK